MTREERNNAIKVLKNFDLNNSKVNSLLFSAEEITNAFDMAIEALEQQPSEDLEYEKDLNELKERMLREGNTLVFKRDLLERFCKIDKDYNGRPWNLLQILANINILIGEEPCEDVISRKDALMCMTGEYVADMTYKPEDIISKHIKRLRALPFVQPKTKIGQWVLLDECSNSGYYCSECHKKLVKEGWSNTVKKIKYCPNCGAKMINVPDINDGKLSEIPTGSESEDKE